MWQYKQHPKIFSRYKPKPKFGLGSSVLYCAFIAVILLLSFKTLKYFWNSNINYETVTDVKLFPHLYHRFLQRNYRGENPAILDNASTHISINSHTSIAIRSVHHTLTSVRHENNGEGIGFLNSYLSAFNKVGQTSWGTGDILKEELSIIPTSKYKIKLWKRMFRTEWKIKKMELNDNYYANKQNNSQSRIRENRAKVNINVATVACGGEIKRQVMVMLKSAVIFSQDANLNVIVFSDNSSIISLGESLLELKWTVNKLGWDFTFELFQEWFPSQNTTGIKWRRMWQPCSTQRLFFPSLLPHIDSLIYLDADTIVLSNLTEMWINFDTKMRRGRLAAMSANTEYPAKGHYGLGSKVPYYGYGGLNAGVMLMNLTRMRQFHMERRSVAAYVLHREKIILADQDIYNIIFHSYPGSYSRSLPAVEKMYLLECSYNLNWVHCGEGPQKQCVHNIRRGPICFCKAAMKTGLRIAHGNMGSFFSHYPFLTQLFERFEKLDLLKVSIWNTIEELIEEFDKLETPCFSLTSQAMYGNALQFLKQMNSN